MYKNKKTGIVGIIITILILIAVVFLSNLDMQRLAYVENSLNKIVMPIQNGLTYLKNHIERKSFLLHRYTKSTRRKSKINDTKQ